jgi:sulfur-oxidizing protein SoxZ
MVARVQLPATARSGELIEVRITIQHPMETGFRFELGGKPIPKNVINSLLVRYNGAQIFRAEMGSGIAANPYLQFHTVAKESGEIEVAWIDDNGERGVEKAAIAVTRA